MNSRSGPSCPDPYPPVVFLQSCPTLSTGIFVFRIYEAVVRDLRQPASSGPSFARHQSFGTTADEVQPSLRFTHATTLTDSFRPVARISAVTSDVSSYVNGNSSLRRPGASDPKASFGASSSTTHSRWSRRRTTRMDVHPRNATPPTANTQLRRSASRLTLAPVYPPPYASMPWIVVVVLPLIGVDVRIGDCMGQASTSRRPKTLECRRSTSTCCRRPRHRPTRCRRR